MIPSIILRSPSTAIIKQTLLSSGPCTTQALHTLLHQTGNPLPSRPSSSSFLSASGGRTPSARSAPSPPPQPEGTWSKSYLKHRLLAPMEQRGELVKITRGRWEKAAGVSSSAPTASSASGTAQQKGQHKHEEEHVWVVGEEWQRVLEGSKEQRAAEKAARRAERDQGVGAELKRDWGVSM